jgi:hypothetical protein
MPKEFDLTEMTGPVTPPERQNVVRKNVVAKTTGRVGDVAHYHKQENEEETWDQPCLFVEHRIQSASGINANDHLYIGLVVIPQCLADYFGWQESAKREYEQGIFRNKGGSKFVRNL